MQQGQLSKHFDRKEFVCKCGCGFSTVDAELVRVLENVREVLGNLPITINSGCRCKSYNKKVGGAPKSFHTKGKACDFTVKGVAPGAVADCLEYIYPNAYGIIRYNTFTHLDVRYGFYREDNRS